MQSCNLIPPRLVGRAPVCACFSATCVNSACQKVLLSPSLVLPCPLTCAFFVEFWRGLTRNNADFLFDGNKTPLQFSGFMTRMYSTLPQEGVRRALFPSV